MRAATAIFLGLTLIASPLWAEGDDHDEHQEVADADHLTEIEGIRILHAWVNATDDDHAFLFLAIENQTEAEITLTGASTDLAAETHLVAQPTTADAALEEIESLPIPAGSEMDLAPGGVSFELHDLKEALVEGEAFDAIITVEPVGEIEIHVEIEAADATRHSHAGHNH